MARHIGGVVIVLLTPGCGDTVRPHINPVAAAPVVSVASREIDERITGRVVGHDGLPVGLAALTVQRFDVAGVEAETVFADELGGFTLPGGPEQAIVEVRVDATDHGSLSVPIDARDPLVELEIRLGTGVHPGPPLYPLVLTAKLDDDPWSPTAGTLQPHKLLAADAFVVGADGVLTATVPAAPPGVLFTVSGTGGQTPMPASAGPLTFWAGFLLAFAPSRDGQATLRIDLSSLPPADVPPALTVVHGDATAALVRAHRAAQAWGPADDEAPADAATCARVAAAAREGDAATWVYAANFAGGRKCALLPADAVAALQRISADDPRWSLAGGALAATLTAARPVDAAAVDAYEQAFIAGNPDAGKVGELLFTRLTTARGDTARALVATLRAPRFVHGFGDRVVAYDPDRIDVGRPTPEFTIAALGDGPPVTRASLLGTPHVLDFWATWCGPCIAALPDVHAAYAKLHGVATPPTDAAGWRGLALPGASKVAFVSIAVNDDPADVAAFRREQWPMPWLHAAPDGASNALLRRFSIGAVPLALFVDADGIIVQRDGDFAEGIAKLLAKRR